VVLARATLRYVAATDSWLSPAKNLSGRSPELHLKIERISTPKPES
jgi:hypothetical protein